MVWGHYISSKETIGSAKYHEIVKNNILPSLKFLKLLRNWISHHNNDSKHTAVKMKESFQIKKRKVLKWPSQLPDLNTIEDL